MTIFASGRGAVCRPKVAAGLSPGAMPAFVSAGTATDTGTATGVTAALTRPATVTLGEFLIAPTYVGTSNATSISITRHADLAAAGWLEMTGSPVAFGGGIHEVAFFWKIADASDVAGQGTAIPGGIVLSHNGLTSNDRFGGIIYNFSAADGFAVTPFESVSSSSGSGTGNISLNTVTPTDTNRLGVTIITLSQDSQAVSSATGESGSDWTEANEYDGVQELTFQIQTCDLSAGGAVSGGESTHASGANWCVFSFALVPASV